MKTILLCRKTKLTFFSIPLAKLQAVPSYRMNIDEAKSCNVRMKPIHSEMILIMKNKSNISVAICKSSIAIHIYLFEYLQCIMHMIFKDSFELNSNHCFMVTTCSLSPENTWIKRKMKWHNSKYVYVNINKNLQSLVAFCVKLWSSRNWVKFFFETKVISKVLSF